MGSENTLGACGGGDDWSVVSELQEGSDAGLLLQEGRKRASLSPEEGERKQALPFRLGRQGGPRLVVPQIAPQKLFPSADC